jgi:hypothetical protein
MTTNSRLPSMVHICGHCGKPAVMWLIVGKDEFFDEAGYGFEWAILRCPLCHEENIFLVRFDEFPTEDQFEVMYRKPRLLYPYSSDKEHGEFVDTIASDLRNKLASIQNKATVVFLEEAVGCYEHGFYRASIVLSWSGAILLLYNRVVDHHLDVFNAEASRRDNKWKPAKNTDDLGLMKEWAFLDVLEYISVIGKNVKQQLQNALTLRNACGHPASLRIEQRIAAAHMETLILNVFERFY